MSETADQTYRRIMAEIMPEAAYHALCSDKRFKNRIFKAFESRMPANYDAVMTYMDEWINIKFRKPFAI